MNYKYIIFNTKAYRKGKKFKTFYNILTNRVIPRNIKSPSLISQTTANYTLNVILIFYNLLYSIP